MIAVDMDSGEFKGFIEPYVNRQYGPISYISDNSAFGCGYAAYQSTETGYIVVAIHRAGSREFVGALYIASNQSNAELYAVQDVRYGMQLTSVQNLRIADGYLWINGPVWTNADSYAAAKATILRYTLPPSLEMDIEIASEGDRYLHDWDHGHNVAL